jgi:predicted transcriptional regulator
VHGHPTETDAARYRAGEVEKGENVEENPEEVKSAGSETL